MKDMPTILSTCCGQLEVNSPCSLLMLTGSPFEKDSQFMIDVTLLINDHTNIIKTYDIPAEGYAFHLFSGDFQGTSDDEVLVTAQYGGSGDYALAQLYEVTPDQLIPIVNDEMINNLLTYTVEYLPTKQVQIRCKETTQVFTIPLNDYDKEYLSMIYNEDGSVKKELTPSVSPINTIYPIRLPYMDHYTLQTQQRIIGLNNSDTLGLLQNIIDVEEGPLIKVMDQHLVLPGQFHTT